MTSTWGLMLVQATIGPKLNGRRIPKPVILPHSKPCAVCGRVKLICDFYTINLRYHSNCKVCERLRAKMNRRLVAKSK